MKKIVRHLVLAFSLLVILTACSTPQSQAADKEYVLTTDLRDGNMIFLGVSDEINGVANPTLQAAPGETITVTLINGGNGQHDVTFSDLNANTEVVKGKGSESSVTFTVPHYEGEYEYLDSVGNHAELGMKGILQVGAAMAEVQESTDQPAADTSNNDMALAAFQKGACGSCHTIDGVPNASGVIAPDLSMLNSMAEEQIKNESYTGKATTADEYIRESIIDPGIYLAPECPSGACPANVMPATISSTLSEDEINAIVQYLLNPSAEAQTADINPEPAATPEPATGADIVRDPSDLPGPIGNRAPTTVRIDLEAVEVEGQLANGTTFTYWTFNGAVPGPFLRIKVGDTIEVHMKNSTSSTMNHSVDFHAVTGPGGGAVMTQTEPGKETMFTAKALNAGLYVYHCATPMVANHISNGMYGLILVEPEGGLPAVDREFYVMQGDIYTVGAFGEQGHQTTDVTKLLNEDAEYLVFNGAVGALTEQKPLKANVGESVRIFFGVGGPNYTSSFHVIGEIFDRVYDQASLTGAPLTDVQTTLVPPGGATMVEFGLEVPGRYILVDHALSRLQRGLAGFLLVEGPANPEVFDGTPVSGSGH